jgi:integrase
LRTTDRHQALILCRKVSAESDLIMDNIVNNRITPETGRAFLSEIIRKERSKIEQLKMLSRIDSLDPADDDRHDAAMAEAWERVSTHGINHTLSPDASDLVNGNVGLIRKDLHSTARRNAILSDLKTVSGQTASTAMEYAQLMDLYVSGKAKAWAQPIEDDTTQASVPTKFEAPCPDLPDSSLLAVVVRMNAIKRVEGIEEKTLRQYQSFAALFAILSGINDITKIRQPDVKAFRADLTRMPKSWGKSPKDQADTRDAVMAKSAALPSDKVGLSVGTVNRHLEHLNQIAEWARDEGLPVDPNLKPSKLRRKETVRARDKREAFSFDQLQMVFQNPVWTGSHSEYHQTKVGQDIYRNGIYWCPLIGAYTGARREEIAGFAPSDIVEIDGIMCFSIEDSELRRVKNLSSHRIVPIHSQLIELGFLEHVENAKISKEISLFPELYEVGNNAYGRKVGRRMRQIIDQELGAIGEKLSFHSLRHYVQNQLDHASVDDKIVRDIIGHEGKDIHEKVYRKPTPPEALSKAIELLPRFD